MNSGDRELLHLKVAVLCRCIATSDSCSQGGDQDGSHCHSDESSKILLRAGEVCQYPLARPGGNITGLTRLTRELSGKRLELLTVMVPRTSRVGVLWDADGQSAAIGS